MRHVIFYSWQSDLPNNTNRGFIEEALTLASGVIASDLDIEPVIDRDTRGLPGSPDIGQAIFAKIAESDLFVADVTLIDRAGERRTPNPNVLLELGYALCALTADRVLLVMNTVFGRVEELPFDLRTRRVITYQVTADAEKAPARKKLASVLHEAITTALDAKTPRGASNSIEIQQLTNVLNQTHFYERILTLAEDISQLPDHGITQIAKPPAYESARRPLHVRFNEEHDSFRRVLHTAADFLGVQRTRVKGSDAQTLDEILTAMRDYERAVADLARWANSRWDPINRASVPWDKHNEAESSGKRLSALVSQRLGVIEAVRR